MKAILILGVALVLLAALVLLGLRVCKATRLWPAALLIVSAPLEVYRSSSGAGANLSIFRFAIGVAIVAFVVDLARGRQRLPRVLPVPFAIYGALVTWQLISLLFVTANHSLAYRFLGQYIGGLGAAFLITCYVKRDDLRVVVILFGGSAVLPLVGAVYRVLSVSLGGSGDLPGLSELPLDRAIEAARQSGSFLLDGTQRLNATFSDPNHFGFYIATVFLVVLGAACSALFFERPASRKAMASYVLLGAAAVVAVAGTYSRSSWLLAVVGVAVLGVLLGRSIWTPRRTIAACVIGLMALGFASPLIASRLSSSERGNAESAREHEHTMNIALKLVAGHPFSGIGLGGYGRYADEPLIISSSHSTFLTVAAELGVVGIALLLGAISVTLIGAIRSARQARAGRRAMMGGFAAAYAGLAVANVIYEVWMDDFQWVLFGLVLAVTAQPCVALFKGRDSERRKVQVSGSQQAQEVV